MKSFFSVLIITVFSVFSFSFIKESSLLDVGLNAPLPMADEKMKDVSGKEVTLNSAKSGKGILVIFSCNNCPYVKMSEVRMKSVFEECKKHGIGCIIINSNESERGESDSYPEMVKYAASQGYTFPYVMDINSKLADAFGATKTPEYFLFNSSGLIYKGALDDNIKEPEMVKDGYLVNAITALINNEKPKIQETKSVGCSIKRIE
jgi:thioredoxin-related protein